MPKRGTILHGDKFLKIGVMSIRLAAPPPACGPLEFLVVRKNDGGVQGSAGGFKQGFIRDLSSPFLTLHALALFSRKSGSRDMT